MVGLNPSHTYVKDGIYYYGRKVPRDIEEHYLKPRIVMSLRTKSAHQASLSAASITAKLEAYWLSLRLSSMDVPAAHLLVSNADYQSNVITLSVAKGEYVNLKGEGRSKTFFTSAERNTNYVIACLGDRPLDRYTSTDGGYFRDWLKEKGLSTASVRRILTTVKAIVGLAISEHGLSINNGFAGLYISEDEKNTKRLPIASEDIKRIQSSCYHADDDLRWLVAMISDTGMRLAEVVGLHKADVHLDSPTPYIDIKPHKWRSLKTSASTRRLPLVGASLWAAKRVVERSRSEYCFDRYCNGDVCNANSASAALNKWLKQVVGSHATVHGFRHSMRDRLRAIQCPTEIIDACGGWSHGTIGSQYGIGYPIEVLEEWMSKM